MQRRVKIYGHRGARKYAPENTIPAFRAALEQGADGFELDTMLSADGVPVVIHDRSLERTTDGTGLVDRTSSDHLMTLDAGLWFSEDFRGTRIPFLEEVLAELGQKTEINIELKNIHSPFDSLPEKVCQLVKQYNTVGHVLFSSFVPFNLVRVKKILPEAQVALLFAPDLMGRLLSTKWFRFLSPRFIHPHFTSCSARFINNQHEMGRIINTWTVNDEDKLIALAEKGIDGIITDDPALAVKRLSS